MLRTLRQWWCGMAIPGFKPSHQMVLKASKGRIDLECMNCLKIEPGWLVGKTGAATLDPRSTAALRERARRRMAEQRQRTQRGAARA